MTWDAIYRKRGAVQTEPMRVVRLLAEELRADPRAGARGFPVILDAGCGTGRHALYLLGEFPEGTVDACDISAAALDLLAAQARALGLAARTRPALLDLDSELTTPGMHRRYDAVVCTLVIHHGYWRQVEARFAAVCGWLAQDGLLAFAALSASDARVRTGYEVEPGTRLATSQDDGDLPHHFFSREDIDALLGAFDLLMVEEVVKEAVTTTGESIHWEVLARQRDA